jgi:pimeloyl-ACP methyl ester carboxylesterase
MKAPSFWKTHYVTSTDALEIQSALDLEHFTSAGERFELVRFSYGSEAPSILISQGSGGHSYVFAELAYQLHLTGYNVFVMPKHGGLTVSQLMTRHLDALDHIRRYFNAVVGVYGEGLGGYVAFYLALSQAPMVSLVCQNAPAIMTEPSYHEALLSDTGPWARSVRRRRAMLPFLWPLARIAPQLRVPVSSYLSWKDLVDTRPGIRDIEHRLVVEGYLKDPDFDRSYPISAVMSLMSTPPPGRLDDLAIPTMFVVASDGPTPGYITNLYSRLPSIPRKLVPIEGSVYWMLSHPHQAAALISDWFTQTRR